MSAPDFHHFALKNDFSRVYYLWEQLRLWDLFEPFAPRVGRLFKWSLTNIKIQIYRPFPLWYHVACSFIKSVLCLFIFHEQNIVDTFLKISPIASGNSLPETRDPPSDRVPLELWSNSVFLQQELHCTAKLRMFNEVCLLNCYKWLDEKLESRYEELSIENNRVGCSLLLGAVCGSVTNLQRHWTYQVPFFPASGMVGVLGWRTSQHWSQMSVRLSEMFRWIILFESIRFRFPATEIGNAPADFSGSRAGWGESLNILSINPKVISNTRFCLQEKQSLQNRIFFKIIFCGWWGE